MCFESFAPFSGNYFYSTSIAYEDRFVICSFEKFSMGKGGGRGKQGERFCES